MIVPEVGSSSRFTQRSSVDLPEPGRADHAHDLAVVDVEVDALEHLVVAEVLVQVADLDRAVRASAWWRHRVTAPSAVGVSSQATSWVSGSVMIR